MLSEVGSSKGRPYAAEASLLHLRRMPYVLGILGGAALPALRFEITDNEGLQSPRTVPSRPRYSDRSRSVSDGGVEEPAPSQSGAPR